MGIVMAVDGNSLVHRAHHAGKRDGAEGRRDVDGTPLWALEGFLALLAGVIERIRPTHLVLGFDDPSSSLRRTAFADYKGTRSEKDADLVASLELIPRVLSSLGLTPVVPPGLEADDVLASAAAKAKAEGHSAVLVTSDRDALALVDDDVTVLRLVSGGLDKAQVMNPAAVEAAYKVRPSSYRLFAALRGDASDNLVGLPGAGEKTAAVMADGLTGVKELLAAHERSEVLAPKAVLARLADPEVQKGLLRNERLMSMITLPVDLLEVPAITALPGIRMDKLVRALSPSATEQAPDAGPATDVDLGAIEVSATSGAEAFSALAARRGWAPAAPVATDSSTTSAVGVDEVAEPVGESREEQSPRQPAGPSPRDAVLIANPRPPRSLLSS